jgi:hypothetical protein
MTESVDEGMSSVRKLHARPPGASFAQNGWSMRSGAAVASTGAEPQGCARSAAPSGQGLAGVSFTLATGVPLGHFALISLVLVLEVSTARISSAGPGL